MLKLEQTDRVPLIFQGISQQPAEVRRPGQVEDAWNMLFSARDGCSKRYGSWFVAAVPGLAEGSNVRLHPIERDQDEQYLVVYGDGVLRAFQIDGLEATVTISTDAQTYLDANNATANDLRLITIGDTTIIVNTTVVPLATGSPSFTIEGVSRDYTTLIATNPVSGTYWQTRQDTDVEPLGYWLYDLTEGGGGTFASYTGWINGQGANDPLWAVPNGYWSQTVQDGSFYIGFQRIPMSLTGVTYNATTKRLTQAGAFTNYVREDGDSIRITGGTGGTPHVVPAWYPIKSRIDNDTIELEDVAGLGTVNNTDTATSSIGIAITFALITAGLGAADMFDVALNSQSAGRAQGGVALDLLVQWIPYYSGGRFKFTGPFRGTNATVYPPVFITGSGYNYTVSTAPFSNIAAQYIIVAGTGTPSEATLAVEDRWVRQVPPNQPDAVLVVTTMPIQMRRVTIGDHRTPAVFEVDTIEWVSRTSGDENSNPLPDFIDEGIPIADLTRFRNRIGFGAGEHIFFTQADDLFNVFAANAANATESDPIPLKLSGDTVTEADFLIPFRRTVVVFTKAGKQFEASAPDAFTPTTAALTGSTNYYTLPGVRPAPSGDTIMFPGKHDDVTEIYEYRYYDAQASNLAVTITPHVQRLVPDNLRRIVTSPNDGVVMALPDDGGFTGSEIKLYQTTRDEERDLRIQSAWTRIGFEDTSIADIAMIGSNCYLLGYDAQRGWAIDVFGVGPAIADGSPLDEYFIQSVAQCGSAAGVVVTIDGVSSEVLMLSAICPTGAEGTVTVTSAAGVPVPAVAGGYVTASGGIN